MSAYPATRDLLRELLELTTDEAQLPIEILVNLHRGRLRAPLEVLATIEVEPLTRPPSTDPVENQAAALQTHVGTLWPTLANGLAFRKNPGVLQAVNRVDLRRPIGDADTEIMRKLRRRQGLVAQLIQDANEWVSYEPLVALHRTTWGRVSLNAFLPIVEAELRASAEVPSLILTLQAT